MLFKLNGWYIIRYCLIKIKVLPIQGLFIDIVKLWKFYELGCLYCNDEGTYMSFRYLIPMNSLNTY